MGGAARSARPVRPGHAVLCGGLPGAYGAACPGRRAGPAGSGRRSGRRRPDTDPADAAAECAEHRLRGHGETGGGRDAPGFGAGGGPRPRTDPAAGRSAPEPRQEPGPYRALRRRPRGCSGSLLGLRGGGRRRASGQRGHDGGRLPDRVRALRRGRNHPARQHRSVRAPGTFTLSGAGPTDARLPVPRLAAAPREGAGAEAGRVRARTGHAGPDARHHGPGLRRSVAGRSVLRQRRGSAVTRQGSAQTGGSGSRRERLSEPGGAGSGPRGAGGDRSGGAGLAGSAEGCHDPWVHPGCPALRA